MYHVFFQHYIFTADDHPDKVKIVKKAPKKFGCDICGKVISGSSGFAKHKRIHLSKFMGFITSRRNDLGTDKISFNVKIS